MRLYINELTPKNVLSSYNFARNCDLVYAENISTEEYKKLQEAKHRVYFESESMTIYKQTKFTLNENDIIFCNTDFLPNLFSDLKKISKLNNLILLTNQTDTMITNKIFDKKPKCISRWYSINVDYENEFLTPIPYGLSNDYSPKNLKYSDYKNINKQNNEKAISMYVNFRITNYKERELLYKEFEKYSWVNLDSPDIQISEYVNNLAFNNFVLSPWGNGVDTHRLWETLYSGSIPITKYHETFSNLDGLPILFVNDYKEITYELLKEFKNSIEENAFTNEKLNVLHWINKIKENKNEIIISEDIEENNIARIFYDSYRKINMKYKSILKKLIFHLRKVKKIKRYFLKN
tara:strand:+ start:3437 stop:4483 length:1047 start_codon:yes stop_codon:yes gene_type:complete